MRADADTVDGFVLGRDTGRAITPAIGFRREAALVEASGALIVDGSEGHAIIFAPTGAGKKRNVLAPTLLKSDNPAIVVDVKGELALETADRRRRMGHEVAVLDFCNLLRGPQASFNPVDILSRDDGALPDEASSLARLLIAEQSTREPYWDDRGHAVISGLITHVVHARGEEDRSLRRVWQIAHADDPIYAMAVLLDTVPMHPYARAQVASLLAINADQTRSCILSVIHQHLHIFGSEPVQRATSSTSFDIDAVRSGAPMTVYIVIPPTKLRSHAPLLRLWLAAFLSLLFQRTAPPARSTLLLLDEVAQLGRMEQIVQAVTLARGYGARCLLALQSYAQLRHCYPTEHEILIENSAVLATFGHTAYGMSQQLAAMLGDVSAEALFAMRPDQLALRRAGRHTEILGRADYVHDADLCRL